MRGSEAVRRVAIAAAIALLTGCVSARPGADKVQIILDPSAPNPAARGCRVIEETTKIPAGMLVSSPVDERSRAIMRNRAVEIGANTIRIEALGSQRWYVKYYACP